MHWARESSRNVCFRLRDIWKYWVAFKELINDQIHYTADTVFTLQYWLLIKIIFAFVMVCSLFKLTRFCVHREYFFQRFGLVCLVYCWNIDWYNSLRLPGWWLGSLNSERHLSKTRGNKSLNKLKCIARHPCIPPITPVLYQERQWNMKGLICRKSQKSFFEKMQF